LNVLSIAISISDEYTGRAKKVSQIIFAITLSTASQ